MGGGVFTSLTRALSCIYTGTRLPSGVSLNGDKWNDSEQTWVYIGNVVIGYQLLGNFLLIVILMFKDDKRNNIYTDLSI